MDAMFEFKSKSSSTPSPKRAEAKGNEFEPPDSVLAGLLASCNTGSSWHSRVGEIGGYKNNEGYFFFFTSKHAHVLQRERKL